MPDSKTPKIPGSLNPQAVKATTQATQQQTVATNTATTALNVETEAAIRNTGAWKENAEYRKNTARTREDEAKKVLTFTEFLKKETEALKEAADSLGSYRRYVSESFGAVKGLMDHVEKLTSLTSIYTRTLDQLAESTSTYTATMQANTSNIEDATKQADKFFTGMRAASAEAETLAGKYNMQSEAINNATKTATKMFGTQLAAMGDVGSGISKMQANMVIYARYLGVDMAEITQSWNERMEASNMTIGEAQLETALLTKVTDEYTKSLSSLGTNILKTAVVGKKELFEMTKAINAEFKIGVPNVIAYTNVMSKLAVESKKFGGTKNEQKEVMNLFLKFSKDATSMQGGFGIMGAQASAKLWEQYKQNPASISEGLRKRFSAREGMIGGAQNDFMKRQYIMETAGGSGEMLAATVKHMSTIAKNPEALAAMIQGQFGSDAVSSRQLAGAAVGPEGALEKAIKEMEEEGKDSAAKQLDKVSELVKQGANTNDILAKSAKTLNEMLKWITAMAVANPIASLAGGVIAGRMASAGLASVMAAKAPGFFNAAASTAPSLLTSAATAQKTSAALAATGAGAPTFVSASKIATQTATRSLGQKALGAIPLAGELATVGFALWEWRKATNAETKAREVATEEYHKRALADVPAAAARYEETQARKNHVVQLQKDIDEMEKNKTKLTELQKEELRLKKEELTQKKRALQNETKKETAKEGEHGEHTEFQRKFGYRVAAEKMMLSSGKKDAKGIAGEFLDNISQKDIKNTDITSEMRTVLAGNSPTAQRIKDALEASGVTVDAYMKEFQKEAAIRQVEDTPELRERLRGKSSEEIAVDWAKTNNYTDNKIGFSDEQKKAIEKSKSIMISAEGGVGSAGSDEVSDITENSSGIVSIGTKINLRIDQLAGKVNAATKRIETVG